METNIRLLGWPQVERGGRKPTRTKTVALVSYLAVEHGVVSRESIASLLWPELASDAARRMVRTILSEVRQFLPADLLSAEGDGIQLSHSNTPDSIKVDIWEYDRLFGSVHPDAIDGREAPSSQEIAIARTAAGLYDRGFLAGFIVDDCAEFSEWQLAERYRRERTHTELLWLLTQAEIDAGNPLQALRWAHDLVEIDPSDEEAHREIMLLYYETGQRTKALRYFGRCAQVLRREIGTEPDEQTVELAAVIKSARSPAPRIRRATSEPVFTSRPTILRPKLIDIEKELAETRSPAADGNPYLNRSMLPTPRMFFGRQLQTERIFGRLGYDPPQSIALIGERRIGKSSFLNYIRSPIVRHTWLRNPEICHFVYVDFQQAAGSDLISLIVDEAIRQTGCAPGGENADLRTLGEAFGGADMRLILLFDEFEVATRRSTGPEFFGYLRSIANYYPVCFVCAASRSLRSLCATREIADSPFFNIFTEIRIRGIEHDAALSLIRIPSREQGRPLEDISNRILDMAGHHPFFLQMACSAWYEYLEQTDHAAIDPGSTPQAVLDFFREEAYPHFEYILATLPDEEREALRGLSEGVAADPDATERLVRKGYLSEDSARQAPFSLEFREFLVRERSRRPGGTDTG